MMEFTGLLIVTFVLVVISLLLILALFLKIRFFNEENENIRRDFKSSLEFERNEVRKLKEQFEALSNHLGVGYHEQKARVVVKDYKEL